MKLAHKILTSLSAAILSIGAQSVLAETIGFENTVAPGQITVGSGASYSEAGYTLSGLSSGHYLFVSPSATNASWYGPVSGSNFLAIAFLDSPILTRDDGQSFSLLSLDVGIGVFGGGTPYGTIHLFGHKPDSTIFNDDVTINDNQWHHLLFEDGSTFSDFKDLSITVNGATSFSLDNINVSQVPVPAAMWLFSSGLIGLGGVARRRRLGSR